MSDIVINNIEIIIFIGLIGVVALLVVAIIRIGSLFKFFSQTKFHVVSTATTDPITQVKTFQLNIYNRHMNDLRVSSLGYIYQKNNIDFFGRYLEMNNLRPNDKLMVLSRDFVTFKLGFSELKDLVSDINKGHIKVKNIYAYVTDTQGISSIVKAKATKKVIQQLIKEDRQRIKLEQSVLLKDQKSARKEAKKIKKLENKLKRKEKRSKFMFKIKRIFSRKRK